MFYYFVATCLRAFSVLNIFLFTGCSKQLRRANSSVLGGQGAASQTTLGNTTVPRTFVRRLKMRFVPARQPPTPSMLHPHRLGFSITKRSPSNQPSSVTIVPQLPWSRLFRPPTDKDALGSAIRPCATMPTPTFALPPRGHLVVHCESAS